MNEKKKSGVLPIVGLILLLVLCVAGVELIFTGLGKAIPNEARGQSPSVSASQSVQSTPEAGDSSARSAPSFCPFCGENLPSAFQWGQFCPYCGEQVEA